MASFVSSKDLSAKRELKRQARGKRLQEEEEKFTRKEKLKQKHKESGNDRWVLPNIDQRIIDDSLGVSEPKTKTKLKKHKKKKNKKKSSSSSESEEEQWEEKPQTSDADPNPSIRDDWLNFDSIVNDHTFTSTSLKEEKKREKDKKNKGIELGQHPRELNPFWKDGGTGLPSDMVESIKKPETKPTKINKDWLLRSLKRMNEQAEEQGRSIEDIAAERYESWEEFQKLLAEADPGRHQSRYRYHGRSGRRFMRPDSDDRDRRRDESRTSSERRDRKDYRDTRNVDEHTHSGSRHHGHSSSEIPAWKKGKSPVSMTEGTLDELERKCREKIKEKIAQEQKAKDRSNQVKDVEVKTNSKPNPSEQKSESATPTSIAPASVKILTEKEKNQLGAKILKAELVGNEKLANTLKMKLERAWEAEKAAASHDKERVVQAHTDADHSDDETVVLTRTGKDGQTWPLQHSDMAYDSLPSKRRKKSKKLPTHAAGERERYFADDDRYSLKDLVMRERTQEAESNTSMLSRLASKQFMGTDSEYFTLDDKYVSEAARQSTRTEEEAIQRQRAMADHKKLARRMEKCHLCFGNTELSKHLLIAIGKKAYLALPESKPLTEGHCFIAPLHHCSTGTGLDEDVWDEIRSFMLALKNMFESKDMDCVFMQTCMSLSMSRHFLVDCIPLPRELGDVAPIYYKKAIQESENEWTNNKKLIDTRNKDLRRCVPKGLPYFAVEFGTDGGFAHVIEDEALFPVYFGKEIVGGMLDVTPNLWRRPPKDHFGEQTKRSLQFSEWWKNYDWTVGVTGHS